MINPNQEYSKIRTQLLDAIKVNDFTGQQVIDLIKGMIDKSLIVGHYKHMYFEKLSIKNALDYYEASISPQIDTDTLTKRWQLIEFLEIKHALIYHRLKSFPPKETPEEPCYIACPQNKTCSFIFQDPNASKSLDNIKELKVFLKSQFPDRVKKKYAFCLHNQYGKDISGKARFEITGFENKSYNNATSELKRLKLSSTIT
jgi:hypothetical protein